MQKIYSNGKLLITGEYLVLDGAKSLAIPTKFGQNLIIQKTNQPLLTWESFDNQNKLWFTCNLTLPNLEIPSNLPNNKVTQTLQNILVEARKLNPQFLDSITGFHIKTNLTFPTNWGLGTSSTLINNIANWAKINAFTLLKNSFGGSGYDIACAENNSPITYQLQNNKPIINPVKFNPNFTDKLYFIHLNKKQDSKKGIQKYRENKNNTFAFAEEISGLTEKIITSNKLDDFNKLIAEHEKIIASVTKQTPVQKQLFNDYFGQTKSLGAWGGDFILATGNNDSLKYFKNKGFQTIVPYQEMIL